jgi:replication factor A1
MQITDLTIGQGNVEVSGVISEMGETRTFNKFGKELKVSNAILKDESGSIKLSLWNEDTEKFKEGDRVRVINGYVSEFQGEKQLTSGKFGNIEAVDAAEHPDQQTINESAQPEETSEPNSEEPQEEVF